MITVNEEPCSKCRNAVGVVHTIGGEVTSTTWLCRCPERINGECTCEGYKSTLKNGITKHKTITNVSNGQEKKEEVLNDEGQNE